VGRRIPPQTTTTTTSTDGTQEEEEEEKATGERVRSSICREKKNKISFGVFMTLSLAEEKQNKKIRKKREK
jgi:hypothetical protein